jgi:hypothetical protein
VYGHRKRVSQTPLKKAHTRSEEGAVLNSIISPLENVEERMFLKHRHCYAFSNVINLKRVLVEDNEAVT